jgi:hypothetical protein
MSKFRTNCGPDFSIFASLESLTNFGHRQASAIKTHRWPEIYTELNSSFSTNEFTFTIAAINEPELLPLMYDEQNE